MSSELENTGPAPARVASVRLADWSFRVAADADAMRYRELSYRNETWYGSTFWSGPDWTRVGKDWHHPGENTPSVRRFTAPRDGRVTITGRIYKAHVDKSTDGVRLAVRHNAADVWKGEIGGDDARGLEPHLTLDVRKGDAIRFIVHKRGTIYCDTTHWDPAIAYAGGPAFQASQGFAATRRPESPWSYEMELDARSAIQLPVVHGFRRDGSLYEAMTGRRPPGRLLPARLPAGGRDRRRAESERPCAGHRAERAVAVSRRARARGAAPPAALRRRRAARAGP